MVTAKQCHTLTSYYITLYEQKYGSKPIVNRNSARWGFDGVLTDMGMTEAKHLLDYYFTTIQPKRHALNVFFYSYDELYEAMKIQEEDIARRAEYRKETKKRAEEWVARGHKRIADNSRSPED